MERTNSQRTLVLMIVAGALALIVAASAVTAVFAMSYGGWGMGSGHMQRMMGGGTNSSSAPLTAGSTAEAVVIRDFAFAPGNLQVPVGATVTWTNNDDAPHTATARDGSWDTGILNKGEKKAITFEKAGEYEYYCKVHPNMIARLTVR